MKKIVVNENTTQLVYEDECFNQEIKATICTNLKTVYFVNCTFNKSLYLRDVPNLQCFVFDKCTFAPRAKLSLRNAKCQTFRIKECISEVSEDETKTPLFEFSFLEVEDVLLEGLNLRGKSKFQSCVFKAILSCCDLSNSELQFNGCQFKGDSFVQKINDDNFYLSFNMSSFYSGYKIVNSKLSKLQFHLCVINAGGNVAISSAKIETVTLNSVPIHGSLCVIDDRSEYESIDIHDCIITGGVSINLDSVTSPLDAETANALKNVAIRKNDYISARKLHKIEMLSHENELKPQFKNTLEKCCGIREKYTEYSQYYNQKIIHCLNKISNNHGTSWTRGVVFTVGFAVVFAILICLSLYYEGLLVADFSCSGFEFFGHCCMDVLNIIRYTDNINGIDLSLTGRILHLLSRIVIAYGVYQVVSAFRSYGRKT